MTTKDNAIEELLSQYWDIAYEQYRHEQYRHEKRAQAQQAQEPVGDALANEVQALAEWHSKTSELWPSNMEQSAFHNKAAITLLAVLKPAPQQAQEIAMVDAAMVEMKNITPPLRRSECLRLIRAAISAQPTPKQAQEPTPPFDENIADAWMSASDSDGISYDGPSFERGYRLGRGEYDEYTGALVAVVLEQAQEQVTSRCANCGKLASLADDCISDYPEDGEWFCSQMCRDQHGELDCPHLTHDGYRHPSESQRLIDCEAALRNLASWLGVGGYNAPQVDASVFEEKIRYGIEHLHSGQQKNQWSK